MNKIYDVNEQAMCIECGTGGIYKYVEWAANEKGYATMHYPSSLTCSTVDGFLAHRGIGVSSTKYGKIDNMTKQTVDICLKKLRENISINYKTTK